jgi:hypothetical protein
MRWFRKFRIFVELFKQSFIDIATFLVVFIIMMVSFTCAFWNINRHNPRILGPSYCYYEDGIEGDACQKRRDPDGSEIEREGEAKYKTDFYDFLEKSLLIVFGDFSPV